jgi:hypothetical protein
MTDQSATDRRGHHGPRYGYEDDVYGSCSCGKSGPHIHRCTVCGDVITTDLAGELTHEGERDDHHPKGDCGCGKGPDCQVDDFLRAPSG